MQVVHRTSRATVYRTADGRLCRQYHDTGAWDEASGVDAREALYGGADDDEEAQVVRRDPPYLVRARERVRGCESTRDFARRCGVARATAWTYACQIAQRWPEECVHLVRFVYPPLPEALRSVDVRGALQAVMQRLEQGPLRGDVDWRCLDDRYSHLRLARLCCVDVPSEDDVPSATTTTSSW